MTKEKELKIDQDPEYESASDKTSDVTPVVTSDSLVLNSIKGDFNGDGKQDVLKETLTSSVDHKSIGSLPQIEYDSLVEFIHKKKPILSLRSEDKQIPELILTKKATFGILWVKNEGDLDNDGSDEFSVVLDWADWSAINTCVVYSLKNGKWTEFAKFSLREWQITDDPNFKGFIRKNKKGEFEVLTFDSEMNEVVTPLKKVLTVGRSVGL